LIAKKLPVGRGAEPHVRVTVAKAQVRPSLIQPKAVLMASKSSTGLCVLLFSI
jgi:hypothetical protein